MDDNTFEQHDESTVETSKEAKREAKAQVKRLKDDWYEKFEEQQLLSAMQGYAKRHWEQFHNFYPVNKKDFAARMERITERTARELEILERMMMGDI